jgi:Family of unknown function (DUF6510)
MTDNGSDLVLDGNAAAGLLQEIFVLDITTAQIQCEACSSTAAVGALRLYAAPMGAVLKVHPLRWRSHEGCPYTAWSLA